MPRKIWMIAALLFALLPSAWLAWRSRAMPHLGFYHDDSIYWVSAKSLAQGDGYRILSLPKQPAQTKYPPLYPALLSLVWRINPKFPANLPIAMIVAWCMLPVNILMMLLFLRQYGFTGVEQVVLCTIAALNPMALIFSIALMPELLFMAFFMGSLLLAERGTEESSPAWLAAVAGLLAGLAYLTKSAALPLLVTVPLCYGLKRHYRQGLTFFACMLPGVAAWQLWVRMHVSNSWDLVTLYYTNYLGFQIYNVPLSDLPLVVWHNLDNLVIAIGKLLTFDVQHGSRHLERVVAAAAIAGCVRLARKSRKLQFPLAAAGFCLLLLIWHYPPDQRFVLPLYPFLLAGFWTEVKNICKTLRNAWAKPAMLERVAAAAAGIIVAGFGVSVAFTGLYSDFAGLPRLLAAYGTDLEGRQLAYHWIAREAPADANVLAYDDPLVYLYTGRGACGIPIPPKFYYHDDDPGIERLLGSVSDFAGQNRLQYVLLTKDDFYRDLSTERLWHIVAASRRFQLMFQTPSTAIYRLNP